MKLSTSILALMLLFAVGVSCRLAERLTGDNKSGTVSSLWPDVPPLEGATKSDLELPLGARLALRAMMRGKINFISFKTNKTTQDVKDFYSNDRMKNAGWTPNEKGCVGDTEDKENHGAICLYQKKEGAKNDGLAIVVAEDPQRKETNIFYARFDMTE